MVDLKNRLKLEQQIYVDEKTYSEIYDIIDMSPKELGLIYQDDTTFYKEDIDFVPYKKHYTRNELALTIQNYNLEKAKFLVGCINDSVDIILDERVRIHDLLYDTIYIHNQFVAYNTKVPVILDLKIIYAKDISASENK